MERCENNEYPINYRIALDEITGKVSLIVKTNAAEMGGAIHRTFEEV